jgi:uncharacterized protein YwgA
MSLELDMLKSFLDRLEVGSSIDSIDNRLIIQKAVFLGQCINVPFRYSYSWYVKGPYSPSLASAYYSLDSERSSLFEFNGEIVEKIVQLKQLLDQEKDDSFARWLESLGSVAFLIKRARKAEEEALEAMKKHKPHIDIEMNNRAIAGLKTIGILED